MLQTASNVPIKPFETGVGTFCIICFTAYKACGIHFSTLVNESYVSVLVSLDIFFTQLHVVTLLLTSTFLFPI